MMTKQNKFTCNIRIPKQTHEQLKQKCEKEGRIIGAYVDMVLKEAISKENTTEVSRTASEG